MSKIQQLPGRRTHLVAQQFKGRARVKYTDDDGVTHVYDSITEVRWKILFDCSSIWNLYHYEPWNLPKYGPYEPDFLADIGGLVVNVEIKGAEPTKEEIEKCQYLAILSRRPTVLFYGVPGCWWPNKGPGGVLFFHHRRLEVERDYVLDLCPACGKPWLRKLGDTKHSCGRPMPVWFNPKEAGTDQRLLDAVKEANTRDLTGRDLSKYIHNGIYREE